MHSSAPGATSWMVSRGAPIARNRREVRVDGGRPAVHGSPRPAVLTALEPRGGAPRGSRETSGRAAGLRGPPSGARDLFLRWNVERSILWSPAADARAGAHTRR